MNIKNEQTVALARQVAEQAGESLTAAITIALEERLAHLERTASRDQLGQDLARLSADIRQRWGSEPIPDHGALLYDDQGLPA